jgi:NAD(P)-dependent dehydrogenase (short-subunit alcohol dehydrogenase family)
MRITDKVALVTGGASGLGQATVRPLVAGGATVVIVDRPSSSGKVVAEELGPAVMVAHPAWLGQPEEYGPMVSRVIANPMLNGEVIRLDGAIPMTPR